MTTKIWIAKAIMVGCVLVMLFLAMVAGNGMAVAALFLGFLVGIFLPIIPDPVGEDWTADAPAPGPIEDWLARMRYEAGRLRTQYDSAVWLDAKGDLIPLCLMDDNRLDKLMTFLQRRVAHCPHRPLSGQPETTSVYHWLGLVFAEQQRRYEAALADHQLDKS